jgi:hypothetical protein
VPEPPKAHRRLVPRVTRSPDKPKEAPPPEDLDATAKRVIIALDEPDESLELTAIRSQPAPPPNDLDDLDLELTSERRAAPAGPAEMELDEDEVITSDPDDAGETMAIPTRAETEPPQRESEPEMLISHGDDDPLEPPKRQFPIPTYAMVAVKDGSVPRYGPNWSTLAGGSQVGPDVARGSQADYPIPPGSDPDPNAFSDLEPTSLKPSPSANSDVEERPTTHISPAERGLLAAMAEGHEASRKIYMQWLERRGEKQRAEFLRLEIQLAVMNPLDIRYQETQDQLRELAQKISVDWRSRVARSLIEGCTTANCPTHWRALPADGDDVRSCGTCHHQVFYCVTIELARGRVQAGQRVALDVTVERSPDDLIAVPLKQCAGCHGHLPANTRFCPHCGRSTMY